ncbi:MAG: helix-hairpin-helix domain-containing protein [Solirubrobacterales bacterium]
MESEQPTKGVEGQERALEELRQRLEEIEVRVVQAEERAGSAEDRARFAEQRAEQAARREEQLRAELAAAHEAAERRVEVHNHRTQAPVSAAEEEMSDFPDLAREVEERVRAIEDRVASSNRAIQELAAPGAPPAVEPDPDPDPDEGAGGMLDINRISFEQLRDLGLTVTQAARLLASRDARGRFRSLDELNELWGFSRDLIENLMRRLNVGGSASR